PPPAAAGAGRAARGTTRGTAVAAGTGTDAGRDRRSDRRGPGNRQVAPALCDGQAAREAAVMTRLPRQPLDADERALANALPRPHGRDARDAALAARVVAAARAAAQASANAARGRRWTVPLGLAASLCLALGLAWRTQLDAARRDAAPATQTK